MSNRRFEVFKYRQVLTRMRQGDSDRDIAGARLMGRGKLKCVRKVTLERGWLELDRPLPDDAELAGIFGRDPGVARSCVSTLEPFRELIRSWFDAGARKNHVRRAQAQSRLHRQLLRDASFPDPLESRARRRRYDDSGFRSGRIITSL